MNDRIRQAMQEVEAMLLDSVPKTRCMAEQIAGWNCWQQIIRPVLEAIPDPAAAKPAAPAPQTAEPAKPGPPETEKKPDKK